VTPEAYSRLKTLDAIVPPARAAFDALIAHATAQGFQPYIVSAVRTCAEESGMTQTKVRRSWHVLGRAVDVELHAHGSVATMIDAYQALGEWWEALGGTWGGRWTTLYPVPHPAGWCGPADMPGDVCHFQWTDGAEAVPESVWPRAVTACGDVDRLVNAYRASQGAPPLGALQSASPLGSTHSSPSPSAVPGAPLARRSVAPAALAVGALLAVALRARARRGRA
jgi:hypothetical protein